MSETKQTCVVRDELFVEPCKALEGVTDNITPGFSRKKGISRWSMFNFKTHKPSRTYFGVKSNEHPNGFLFNFCPFCGTQIDAPFTEPTEPAQPDRLNAGEAV